MLIPEWAWKGLQLFFQNEQNNFNTDLFKTLINEVGRLTNRDDLENPSLRVIADHLRASSFLIADGIVPSNEVVVMFKEE